ncbi:MAG: GNAT family acetyltransferase [Dehalococcoidales bacterium]|nr:GNAT family acetyltransferase [Dehalococcoidales bacterium]
MHIRCYLPEDETTVISLWQQCRLTKPWNNPKLDIERKLKDSPELFFVGLVNAELISTAMAGYDGHRGWIYYLAVAPKYRRQGYGRQMMAFVENRLKEMECPKIDLMVRTNNMEVVQFYSGIGYSRDEVITLSKRLVDDAQLR